MGSQVAGIRQIGWRQRWAGLSLGLMLLYGVAIFLDLPAPAGNTYTQNLPAAELIKWGVSPVSSEQPAAHWWYKIQGLRGWSTNPEGWEWPKIEPAPLSRWLVLLEFGALGALALWRFERRTVPPRKVAVAAALISLVLFPYLLQFATLWLKSSDPRRLLVNRITDRDFTGYLNSAIQIQDPAALFSEYEALYHSPAFCAHFGAIPPDPSPITGCSFVEYKACRPDGSSRLPNPLLVPAKYLVPICLQIW